MDKKTVTINGIKAKEQCRLDENGEVKVAFRFALADCVARVEDGEKEIGTISGTIGGGVEISSKGVDEKQRWYISPVALWNAFHRSMGREDLCMPEKEE
jgi:hypothetical protein